MVNAGSEKKQVSPKHILSPRGARVGSPSPVEPLEANKAFQSAAAMKASSAPGLKVVPLRVASPGTLLAMS